MWYIPAPASSASRRAMSAIVVLRKTSRSASTPSSQMPPASLPSCPDPAVERLHDLEHGDLLGGTRERVAALDAAMALQEPVAAQGGEQLLEELHRHASPLGDLRDRDRPLARPRQLGHGDHRVARLRGDGDHRRSLCCIGSGGVGKSSLFPIGRRHGPSPAARMRTDRPRRPVLCSRGAWRPHRLPRDVAGVRDMSEDRRCVVIDAHPTVRLGVREVLGRPLRGGGGRERKRRPRAAHLGRRLRRRDRRPVSRQTASSATTTSPERPRSAPCARRSPASGSSLMGPTAKTTPPPRRSGQAPPPTWSRARRSRS